MHHQRCFSDTEAGTTEFLGHGDSQPSAIRNGPVEVLGKIAALVPFQPVIIIKPGANLLHRIAYGFLVRRQRKIHR